VVDYPRIVRIAPRRAELGWRGAVLDEEASRHVFRLRATEEGSGCRAPASASGASNQTLPGWNLDAVKHLAGGHVDRLRLRSLLQCLLDGECCLGTETGHRGNLLGRCGTQLLE
jgi:hypothetical protein